MMETVGSEKKKGRPRIESRIHPEKILKAFKVHGNSYRASKALGISTGTVTRVLKDQGIDPKEDRRVKDMNPYHFSSFAKWARWYDRPIPRSVSKIVKLAKKQGFQDVTKDAVQCYLYRRKKKRVGRLRKLTDLRETDYFLEDMLGKTWRTKDIKAYKYRVDRFSLDLSIYAEMKDGTATLFEIENPKAFISELTSQE